MPASAALQFPARGQYYESADGAETFPGDPGIVYVTQDCVFASIKRPRSYGAFSWPYLRRWNRAKRSNYGL